ncbi:unnamed protein product [Prorocentrum cordatum]|uniref:Uncharacterized protein n=1 Tax=Prorocentrum cordatum TaxID=2364126 RepID=A0ABN9YDI9_9DINO|nr:unnamed protein product [Polarella glacialis]
MHAQFAAAPRTARQGSCGLGSLPIVRSSSSPTSSGGRRADFEAIIGGLTTIFGCAELADRIVALAPALGEKLAGRVPSAALAVRRNVALHSDARGVRVSTATIEQLRRLQKYGVRLEARAEAESFTFNADAAEFFPCGPLGTRWEFLPLPGVLGYSESGLTEAVEGTSLACAGDGGEEHDVGPACDVPSKVITPEFFAAGRKSSFTSAPSLGLCPVEWLRQGGGVPVRAFLPREPLRADGLPDLLAGPGPAAEGGCCSTLDELLEAEVLKYEALEAARASPRAVGAQREAVARASAALNLPDVDSGRPLWVPSGLPPDPGEGRLFW